MGAAERYSTPLPVAAQARPSGGRHLLAVIVVCCVRLASTYSRVYCQFDIPHGTALFSFPIYSFFSFLLFAVILPEKVKESRSVCTQLKMDLSLLNPSNIT